MGGRIYSTVVTIRGINFYNVLVNPNGVLTAPVGSIAVNSTTSPPTMYRNLDGATLWLLASLQVPFELVFQPGGTDVENAYTTWSDLIAAHDALPSFPKVICFSDEFATPSIPISGGPAYDFSRTNLLGVLRAGSGGTQVTVNVDDGVEISGMRVIENLRLERQAGASALPIANVNTSGITRLLLRNSTLCLAAGSTAPFIEVSDATADFQLRHEDGDLETLAAGVPVIDVTGATAFLRMAPLRANLVSSEAIRTAVGTTFQTAFQGGDSRQVLQTLISGSDAARAPFPDGVFKVTYSPSNPNPSGFVFTAIADALAVLTRLPTALKKELAFDDTYVAGLVPIPAAAYVIPSNTTLTDGRAFQASSDTGRIVVTAVDGTTMVFGDDTIRIRNLEIRHIQSAPLVSSLVDVDIAMENSRIRMRPAASDVAIRVSGGAGVRVIQRDAIFDKDSDGLPAVIEALGGGEVTLTLRGDTQWTKDVINTDSIVSGTSSSDVDEGVRLSIQPRLQVGTIMALRGEQGSQGRRVTRRRTVLVKTQLQGTGGVPKVHQSGIFFLNDATLPLAGDTFILNDGTNPAETFTFVVGPPGVFEIEIGATVEIQYANFILDINTNSVLYDADGMFDAWEWTASTTFPGQAVALTSKTQTTEATPHRMYGVFAAAAPRVASFEEGQQDYSNAPAVALPAADPGTQFGFGWGSAIKMQDVIITSVVEGRQTYTTRNGSTTDSELWQRSSNGPDGLQALSGAGATAILRSTRLITFTLAAAVIHTATLPPIASVPIASPINVRRKDADGASTATLAATVGELIDGVASIPVGVTSGLQVMHDGTEWYSF